MNNNRDNKLILEALQNRGQFKVINVSMDDINTYDFNQVSIVPGASLKDVCVSLIKRPDLEYDKYAILKDGTAATVYSSTDSDTWEIVIPANHPVAQFIKTVNQQLSDEQWQQWNTLNNELLEFTN